MKLYQDTFSSWDRNDHMTDKLLWTYSVADGWTVLNGAHHRHLNPDFKQGPYWSPDPTKPYQFVIVEGIVDLVELYKEVPSMLPHILVAKLSMFDNILEQKLIHESRALFLAIDPARPPDANLKALRSILKERYRSRQELVKKPFLSVFLDHYTAAYHL